MAFRRLQLVVVDEQHRFGVRQREALKQKGLDPHWLVMSATPIPRSLALALFGDLEQSVLDELPPGRQPITTRLLAPADAERAWDLVERELKAGHQAFVVSPAIDPQDEAKVPLRDIQAMEALLAGPVPGARTWRWCTAGSRPTRMAERMEALRVRPGPDPPGHHRHRSGRGRAQRHRHGGGPRRAVRPQPAAPAARPGGPGRRPAASS